MQICSAYVDMPRDLLLQMESNEEATERARVAEELFCTESEDFPSYEE